jgi:hypothetical protein
MLSTGTVDVSIKWVGHVDRIRKPEEKVYIDIYLMGEIIENYRFSCGDNIKVYIKIMLFRI